MSAMPSGVAPAKERSDHGEGAADEVAVAVGEVGVVAGDEGVEGEAAVLAEGDLAEEEVAEDVGGEEVLFVLCGSRRVLREPKASRMVSVRTMLPRDFDIFDSSKSKSQPWAMTALGSGRFGGEQEGGPVDAVEADDLFADEVEVGGPVFFEFGLVGGVFGAVADGGHVVGEGVEPDVDDVFFLGLRGGFGRNAGILASRRMTDRWRGQVSGRGRGCPS